MHQASTILNKSSIGMAKKAEAVISRCIITQSNSGCTSMVRTASSYSRIGTSLSRNSNKFLRPASSMSSGKNNKQQAQHSTASATDMIQSTAVASGKSSTILSKKEVPRPTLSALRTLFTASAIPMVGFGFMDNLVMIQAGQYIDSTLGVSLGLATMTAAAAGQVVSDVSGVVFGGTLERFLMRFSLISSPALTVEQRQLAISRNVAMAGAVVGVVCGCALGATTLLLVDLEARERVERAIRLKEIVRDMINEEVVSNAENSSASANSFKTCTIYVAAESDFTITKSEEDDGAINMKLLRETKTKAAHQCFISKQAILSESNETLFVPVVKQKKGDDDEVMAVLAFHCEKSGQNTLKDEDVLTAKVMARHIAIFMDRLVEM